MGQGAWHEANMSGDKIDHGGCVNTLTTLRPSPLAKGYPQHTNLVESENWTLYDYKAVCVPDTLVAYMAEKDCDYILIDRADDYLQREFSPLFEGGLTNDMPATLYHFEGADAAVPFKLAAVAESGVE